LGGLLTLLGATALVLLDRTLRANVDASLVSVAHTVAASSLASAPPGPDLDEALGALLGPALAERFFQLLDPLARPHPRLPPRPRTAFPLSPAARGNAAAGRETFETLTVPAVGPGPVRLLTFPVVEGGRLVNLVQVAMPLAGVEAARTRFLLILVGLAPLALAGVAAGGWVLTGRALAPLGALGAAGPAPPPPRARRRGGPPPPPPPEKPGRGPRRAGARPEGVAGPSGAFFPPPPPLQRRRGARAAHSAHDPEGRDRGGPAWCAR